MSNDKKDNGITRLLIISIIVPLIAGGTSPWWYDKFFKTPIPPSSIPNQVSTPLPVPSTSLSSKPSSDTQNTFLKATINLKKGQQVERRQTVTGTVAGNIPSEKILYFYVHVPTLQEFSFYYFPVTLDEEKWSSRAIFGAVEDSNQDGIIGTQTMDYLI
jgi:hypothetical protein